MSRKANIGIAVFLWALCCLGHYGLRTAAIRNAPHEGDPNAYSWGFQALRFAVFPFPLWLLGLGIAILWLRGYRVWERNRDDPGPRPKDMKT